MRVTTLLNHIERYKGFVYEACELNRDADVLTVFVRERAGTRVSCPRCGRRCTVYDHLPSRRHRSVPLRMVEVVPLEQGGGLVLVGQSVKKEMLLT